MKVNIAAERLHKDLLTFRAKTERRFDRMIGRLDNIIGRLDKIDGRLGRLDRGLRGLRTDMPKIVGDALRDYEIRRKMKL
jgi:hypothetical protein